MGRDSASGAWVCGGRIAGSDAKRTHSSTGTRDGPTSVDGTPNADLFTLGGGAARSQMRDGNQIWAGIRHQECGFVEGG